MQYREIPRLGRQVSVIGLGTWQLGGDWGAVSDADAFATLDAAAESGVTLFDTADVYGDGRSEQLIGRWKAANPGYDVLVATKVGRRVEQIASNYDEDRIRRWVDRSRHNLGMPTLDLVQLHCPPTAVFRDDAVFDALDGLVHDQVIRAYGVSVEETSQALTAIERPGVATVQIIFNPFRLKPIDRVLPTAEESGVGVFARVPLASGLLSGKYTAETVFDPSDHRSYNRDGSAFDRGETFSGIDLAQGVRAADELAAALPNDVPPAEAALAWIIRQPGVSAAIPGARNEQQARSNAAAADTGALDDYDRRVPEVYDRYFRDAIHDLW